MKKTAEITRLLLFGQQRAARAFRTFSTLLLAAVLFFRPYIGALAGSGLFLCLAAAAVILAAGRREKRYRLALAVTALAAAGAVLLFFFRRDRLGVIGIGLWVILLGLGRLPELRRGGGSMAELLLNFLEVLFPFLLGCTFLLSANGSFDLAAPFYALTLAILALQRL